MVFCYTLTYLFRKSYLNFKETLGERRCCTATCRPSQKPSLKCVQHMQGTAGEVRTKSSATISCGLLHMDTRVLANQQRYKNAASCFEQILAAAPEETAAVQPLTTHLKNILEMYARHARYCWWSENELISDDLLWTPRHGHTSVAWPTKTYIHLLCGH